MRVVVADDSLLVRAGIARLLEADGIEVAGVASDREMLLELVRATRPEVAIIDIRMPPTHTDEGLRAVREIRAEHAGAVAVLVLSQFVEPAFALRIVDEGPSGSGYLLKERVADGHVFAEAVRSVASGGVVIDPEIVARLLGRRQREGISQLTARERSVLQLMAEGRSNQAICHSLRITPKTVEAHVNTIFSKLLLEPAADDNRRVLAVLAYLRGFDDAGP